MRSFQEVALSSRGIVQHGPSKRASTVREVALETVRRTAENLMGQNHG